jgi:hypothetical protein
MGNLQFNSLQLQHLHWKIYQKLEAKNSEKEAIIEMKLT